MRLWIIGGNSRLGRAIARACPSATSMVRGNADGDAVVSVSGYHAARVSDFVGFDAVVNCAGLVKGEVEALHDANVKLPVQLAARAVEAGVRRSEEHTSELQSLMRISYAVFCLTKKKNIHQYKV